MLESPLFSILVANYNNGKFFKDCHNSIISQTYQNWEVIIIDDASTDNSVEIIKDIIGSDNRFKLYLNAENRGCGYTKARCVKFANGELCGFLDPDDSLIKSALEIMQREHLLNPNVSIIFSRKYICDQHLNILQESSIKKIPESKSYLTYSQHEPEHFTTFKIKYYHETIGIDSSILRCVDQDLNFKMEEVGDIKFIEDILYNYRIHKATLSNSGHYKAVYWHFYVIKTASDRRNINGEDVANNILTRYISSSFQTGKDSVKQSRYYKLGYAFFNPSKVIRYLFLKIKQYKEGCKKKIIWFL